MGTLTFAVERFNTGFVADTGIRESMEDTYLIIQDMGLEECVKISLFAVIDGHGGVWCAHFIRKRLENELRAQLNDPIHGFKRHQHGNVNECISNALIRTFNIIDEAYLKEMPEVAHRCGSAACLMLIVGNRIFTANVGDSRAVLSRKGTAINLSYDHKPVNNLFLLI